MAKHNHLYSHRGWWFINVIIHVSGVCPVIFRFRNVKPVWEFKLVAPIFQKKWTVSGQHYSTPRGFNNSYINDTPWISNWGYDALYLIDDFIAQKYGSLRPLFVFRISGSESSEPSISAYFLLPIWHYLDYLFWNLWLYFHWASSEKCWKFLAVVVGLFSVAYFLIS